MRLASTLALAILILLPAFSVADEREQYNQVRELLSKQKLDEAQKLFASALEENPDSPRLKSLHYMLYSYLNRAGRSEEAVRHAEANIDVWLGNLARNPQMSSSFTRQVANVTSTYTKMGKVDVAIEKLDATVDKVAQLLEEKDAPEFAGLVTELRARKALLLAAVDKREAGRELLNQIRDEAKKSFDDNPEEASSVLALANVLDVNAQFEAATEQSAAARKEHLDFLTEQSQRLSSNYSIVSAYYSAQLSALQVLVRSDAAKAEEELAAVEEFFASLDTDDRRMQSLVKSSAQSFSSLKRRITSAKAQQALIGQPSFPLEAEAWVNGDPITDKELDGKVILLDFWAVWCGPCIRTFPHLREWHEQYADKGLVIIGATRYYSYDWDDKTGRIKKVKDLSPEDEQQALVRFAEHHDLKHRFMVMPKSSQFSKKYGVTGIPQAVLIGRDGKVRLIRVGSGDANAHDLDEMIEQLIEEPTAAGGG